MKWLFLLSFTISAQNLFAQRLEFGLDEIRKEIRHVVRAREECAAQVRKLQARLKRPPVEDAGRLRLELDETQQVLAALTQRLEALKEEEQPLVVSPERRISLLLSRDGRRPTKENLSGVWHAGPIPSESYRVQLNQRGKTITGEGFGWGSGPISGPFEVIGSYHAPVLTLTFIQSPKRREKLVFHYREEGGRPRFQTLTGRQLMPDYPRLLQRVIY